MYGKSNLNDKNYLKYVKLIKKIAYKSNNIKILIESNISPYKFFELKKKILETAAIYKSQTKAKNRKEYKGEQKY